MASFSFSFSANTNILSSSHRCLRLSTSSASNLLANLNLPANNNHLYSLNTSTPAAPIFTARATSTDVHDAAPELITTSVGWAIFAENVSGEWDGFGADFTAEGKPIELPESVVPEAYREWEVKVLDWQTQCPTLAQSQNTSPSLTYRTIRLLPTVGCEADAATVYDVQERNISDSAFAYQTTGCYVAVWPVNGAKERAMELEHCLIDPRNKESRVRIIQALEWEESEMALVSIRVFVEQWYGPFRNGDQLGGCSIRDSAFAATEPLKASQVSGVWQGVGAVANFNTRRNMIQQVDDECGSKRSRDEEGLILLPKHLWCSVKGVEEEIWCEVGWLFDEGRAITSKCSFSSATADLKEIEITSETASPV